jgi:hypothetical protein
VRLLKRLTPGLADAKPAQTPSPRNEPLLVYRRNKPIQAAISSISRIRAPASAINTSRTAMVTRNSESSTKCYE